MRKDIYIIKNTVNQKVYIGQSKDAAKRWLSHIYNAKYENKTNKNTQLIHKAMIKYGIDKFHYEILEYQVSNYDEREIYWINKYNSIVPNGYNVAYGGDGTGVGLFSVHSVFENEKQLLRCISEISGTDKTFANIARKFGCSPEVISAINNGDRYKMEDKFEYPLRNTDNKYSMEKIRQIRYSLKYELDLTLKNIAEKYNVDLSQVSLINNGKKYYLSNENYPLRKNRKQELSNETVDNIINDILYSPLCLSDIAAKYNISRARISGINQGIYYKRDAYSYPLRRDNDSRSKSLKKFIDIDIIKEIHKMLRENISGKQIAEKFGISTTTVYNINNGKCKKYILKGEVYPIRDMRNQHPVSTIHA